LWGLDPTNSVTPNDFGNVAVVEAGLLSNIADGQAVLLRLRESLAALAACLRTFALNALLGALKLGLSTAYISSRPSLWFARHPRSLFAEARDTFRQ
jgi:hypothetical protein